MNKEGFQFIQRFILWLKGIFHIYPEPPVYVTQPSEEESVEVDLPKEKEPEVSSMTSGEGTLTKVLQKPFREEVQKVEPLKESKQCPQHPKTMQEIETETQIKYPIEETKTEEKVMQKEEKGTPIPPKPYIKKVHTEERKEKPIKLPITEVEPPSSNQREPVDLGDTQRRRRRSNGSVRKSQSDENIDREKADKTQGERELANSIETPFVEINLDEAKVYLILPKQQFKANTVDVLPRELSYSIELNGEHQEVPANMTTNRDGVVFVEEKRIPLEEPLETFQVAFPDELQRREYNYDHNGKELYVFVAIGNNRGRIYYLYDKVGNINPLPKRDVWMLLDEDFESQTEPDITEERWIWKKYRPSRIDLSEIDSVVIKNRKSSEDKCFSLQSSFRIEGEQLVKDDFKKDCPLFTGKTLKIVAPDENPSGWNVWIQNKVAGYKVKEDWKGKEPLVLKLPEDLPCDCGEFQVDVCKQSTRRADETLFFRFIPYIEFNYPKELLIPGPKKVHSTSMIGIKLDGDGEWKLKSEGSRLVKSIESNSYQLELSSENDTARFSISKQGRPETILNFRITIPRLKWKTSKQKMWDGVPQKIERKELISGEPFDLFIQINDFDNKYDLLALLEANGQKLQGEKFIRKGLEYSLKLNQFFDTIKHKDGELTIRVEIRNVMDLQLLGSVETVFFEGEPKVRVKIPPVKPRETTTPEILIQALVKCPSKSSKVRKGKGFSKKEIIDVGMNLKDVRRLKILYDKRRESSHPWNVASLKSLMGGDIYDN